MQPAQQPALRDTGPLTQTTSVRWQLSLAVQMQTIQTQLPIKCILYCRQGSVPSLQKQACKHQANANRARMDGL